MNTQLPNSFYGALRNVISSGKGNWPAIIAETGEYTFNKLVSAIDAFTETLIKSGVKKGDHVALWGYNSVNWFVAFQAIIKIGATAV